MPARTPTVPVLAMCLSLACLTASAQSPTKLRELATDRPDQTETPFTIDRGHVQLEMSVASFTTDRADGVRTNIWEGAPLNVRYGVADNLEAGIFVSPFVQVEERAAAGRSKVRGFGDTVLRAKTNFWGNDGGKTALGMMADIKLPTAARRVGNNKVETALTFPLSFEVGGGWDGGAMTALEYRYTDERRYRPVWFNTLTFSRDLMENLGAFFEVTSTAGDGAHEATFDTGITRKLSEFTQLDFGVNIGISKAAPDLVVFAGISRKW